MLGQGDSVEHAWVGGGGCLCCAQVLEPEKVLGQGDIVEHVEGG